MQIETTFENDVELRLLDSSRNRFRLYGLTACRTLFGEPCLRVVWGRIGHRRLRERSETFSNVTELEKRRDELLVLRGRHGYMAVAASSVGSDPKPSALSAPDAVAREIIEEHGLAVADRRARGLVRKWHAAASDLRAYVRERGAEDLDLEDVSTLAAMYVAVAGVA